MEILSIIPVRGGSKGIPGKNIKHLCGKPLVAYTIEASLVSKYITRTIASPEDSKIKDVCLSYGAEVIDRPIELAQDETKTAPVMLDVLDKLEAQGYVPDVTVLLQATCPLRNGKDIDDAFELFFSRDCDSVFSVTDRKYTHAFWRQEKDGSYKALYDFRIRPRRQDIKEHYKMYKENGAIYIIKTDVMRKVKDFIGEKPELFVMPHIIDIDELSDFEKVERIMKENNNC